MSETIIRIPGKLVASEYGTKLANFSDLDNNVYGPYNNVAAAHSALSAAGLNTIATTVGIIDDNNEVKEYWYQGGTKQVNLVKKVLGKENDAVSFDGFILLEPVTIIEGSAFEPDAILYSRNVNRFVAKKGNNYYDNWEERGLYNNGNAPYTNKIYPYNGKSYTWNGTTFEAESAEAIRYTAQTLTAAQRRTAQQNIGLEKDVAGGVASLDENGKIEATQMPTTVVQTENGKVPANVLPSYVDDVIEGYYGSPAVPDFSPSSSYSAGDIVGHNGKIYRFTETHAAGSWNPDDVEEVKPFPVTGETGKVYSDIIANTTYRWSGSTYTQIKGDLSLGETSETAFAGNRGKALEQQMPLKQDFIQDLSTIRNNALYGPTSVQFGAAQQLTHTQQTNAQNNMMGKVYAPAQNSGLGKVYLDKNNGVLTQSMMNAANTVYVIQYDFTLGEDFAVPANCVLEFDGGSISFDSYTLSGTILNTVVCQSWFKTIDDFFKFINNVDGPVRYEFTPGEYTATTKVNKNVDSAIVIEGNGVKVNWTPAVANSLGRVFDIHPRGYNDDTLYPSINIPAAINSGDQTFTVADASGFSVGDILALKDNKTSSFFWSRNYQEGEFVKIQKINGTTITVDKPITGDYINVGYLAATKAPLKKCIINNLHLNQTEGKNIVTRGLSVFLMNGEMNNVSVTNFQYNIEAWCCWNFNVNNCFATNGEINYNDGTPDGYALCVNNCQNLKVIGGRFIGKNHGIATGGYYVSKYAIINRFIVYENIETANTVAGGKTDSINAHDDSDYITVKNCVASGISLGGKHHTVTNCKCYGIAISAGNSFEHTITDNIVKYEIEVQMYDHSGSYEYAYGNTKSIDHNESLLVYGNICGTMIIQNRCTESLYDMTKLNVYVKNNVMRDGRSQCYFNLTSISGSTDLDNAASIVLVDNIVDTNSFNFQIICNSALLLDNKIDAKTFNLTANTCTIENCFITVNTNLKQYLYKSIRIVRSRFIADYLNMVIQKNTVTDIVVEDCIFETTSLYYAIRCTSFMNDTNTNIRCVRNFVKGNIANILRIDKVSGVTGGTKTLIFYNNKKNNGEDAGIDNQISTDLVQNIAVGQMRWNSTKPEWWNGTDWVDATGTPV